MKKRNYDCKKFHQRRTRAVIKNKCAGLKDPKGHMQLKPLHTVVIGNSVTWIHGFFKADGSLLRRQTRIDIPVLFDIPDQIDIYGIAERQERLSRNQFPWTTV